jgi:ribosome assembly protein 1
MLMGKELEKIPCAPAGTVFGIGAVEDIILKTATVTTNPACPSFLPMTFGVRASTLLQLACRAACSANV